MNVTCIKCHKNGSLSLNHYKTNGHQYQYYGIQHYNRDTKKRHWCYLGKYESLPESYKILIHNQMRLSTSNPQTAKTGKNQLFLGNNGAGSGIRTHVALRHGILSPAHVVI
jgi:hypothetical protein